MSEIPLAVTDTHALIWAVTGTVKRLGRRARRLFEQADAGECAIYIPVMALIELGEACQAGRIALDLSLEQWAQAAFDTGMYLEAPLTAEIAYRAETLYDIPERGDRLIAATASVLDLPLITRDPAIAAAAAVACLW